jgi:hypothetical protein
MTRALRLTAVVAVVALAAVAAAQDLAGLRRDVEQRFDVLPLQGGLALRPKASGARAKVIELSGSSIAVDGVPATGAELREKIGAEADLVIRLSYLEPGQRRDLFLRADAVPPPAAVPAPATAPTQPEPPARRTRSRRGSSDRVRFAGDVAVGRDEVVSGDVVAIGGSALVDGEVMGDVVAVGGSVRLGPDASVQGDVTVIGGGLDRQSGAHVGGSINEVGVGGIGSSVFGRAPWRRDDLAGPIFGSTFALVGTLVRFAVLSLLVSIVLLIGKDFVGRVAATASAEPIKAGLVGVLTQLLFVPVLIVTIVLLIVTIIGIPLLLLVPFAVLALVIISLIGFAAVTYRLGELAAVRLNRDATNPYTTAILGILVVLSPILLARLVGVAGGVLFPISATLVAIGLIGEYLAWTIGLGAVALLRLGSR